MLNTTWEKCEHGHDPILRAMDISDDRKKMYPSPWHRLNDIQHRCVRGYEWAVDEVAEVVRTLIKRGYGRWFDMSYQFNGRFGLVLSKAKEFDTSSYEEDVRVVLEYWRANRA